MKLKIYTEPAIEPVSIQEIKEHLRLDSGDFSDNLTTDQMIAPGEQAITSGYSLIGQYIDVFGVGAIVVLSSGTVGGTVACKIQDSNDLVAWEDWTGGGFTDVTGANDNAIQKIAYTGAKQYIRVLGNVTVAVADFGVTCLTYVSDATEDDMLTSWIAAARQLAETTTRRAFITQTWDMVLDSWPIYDQFDKATRTPGEIFIPFGQLQSVTSLAYTDDAGDSTTLTVTTDYLVDSFSEPGRLALPPSGSWPSSSLYSVNPIIIRFICGYGSAAADVPHGIRAAIKMMVTDLYYNRATQELPRLGSVQKFTKNDTVANLLGKYTIRDFG